jgi:hypothetical protein
MAGGPAGNKKSLPAFTRRDFSQIKNYPTVLMLEWVALIEAVGVVSIAAVAFAPPPTTLCSTFLESFSAIGLDFIMLCFLNGFFIFF